MNTSTAFGLVAALLAILALGEYMGYIAAATLGGLTVDGLALFTVLAIAAGAAFYWSESQSRPKYGKFGGWG